MFFSQDPEVIIPEPLAGDEGEAADSQGGGGDEEPEPPNILVCMKRSTA